MAELSCIYANEGKPWTATEDSFLGRNPDHVLSVRLRRSIASVAQRRIALATARKAGKAKNQRQSVAPIAITARMTGAEAAACERAAKTANLSLTAWAHEVLVLATRRSIK